MPIHSFGTHVSKKNDMLFASLLASKWRWPAFAIAIIFAVLALTQLTDYGTSWFAHHGLTKQVQATEQQHTARLATEARASAAADSQRFTQQGQRLEAGRHTLLSQLRYDSLRALFPAAVPELPASPPRYRPSH